MYISGYVAALQNIVSCYGNDIDTALCDVNINYFNDNDCFSLESMMESIEYMQTNCTAANFS